jgi:hypothetical protein
MSEHSRAWLFALLLIAAACGDDEPEDKAERGAAIAREIRAAPGDAEEILEEHEMDIEQFEALMYEIAADPDLSERYEELVEAEE